MIRATVFLLPADDAGLGTALGDLQRDPAVSVRVYRGAADPTQLLSLVRGGRDPAATRWIGGVVRAIALGALLGTVTNGVLATSFDMLGGMLELAIPLGLLVGAFLGGLMAAMTGTHTVRDELRELIASYRPPMLLAQVSVPVDRRQELLLRCQQAGHPWVCLS